jgi:hypothetical protein
MRMDWVVGSLLVAAPGSDLTGVRQARTGEAPGPSLERTAEQDPKMCEMTKQSQIDRHKACDE